MCPARQTRVDLVPIAVKQLTLALLLLLLASGSSAVSAQAIANQEQPVDPFLREHNERRAKNPEGLLFTVRFKDNRKQFHQGEVITLELGFASTKPKTFTVEGGTYDRHGALDLDGFVIDPSDGVVDPLADYFDSGLFGFNGGGLRSIPDLTEKPYFISSDLNDSHRFDKPGHYRLYVVSGRVGRKNGGEPGTFWESGKWSVVSNVIEFDILSLDKKWATQKLNESISVLSKPDGDHRTACRALRFLPTTAAAIEMRKRFRDDDNECESEYEFGLIGSPHRDFVMRDMENSISSREQPVSSTFISTLARLEFVKREGPAPDYVGDENDEAQTRQWRAEFDRRVKVYDELCLHYVRQLMIALPQKQGQARAMSLLTLLDYRSQLNTQDFSQWSTLLASMPEVFNRLSLNDRYRLLEREWKPIASTAMLPVLREVLNYSYTKEQEQSFGPLQQEEFRSLAIRRIYELSPEEGRRLILDVIRSPKPRVEANVLRLLPDETLPELNAVLIKNLEESLQQRSWTNQISQLVERYATAEILSRVRAVYETQDADKWECRTQAALLAYFLRVAPSIGGEYLNKAMAARSERWPRCYPETLKHVAELHMSPQVEETAIAALDDDDLQVVAQAATVLGQHGSADAEKPLWRRFEKWNQETSSRSERPGDYENSVEKAFSRALASGYGWLADPEKLKRVRDLCLTDDCRTEVDRMITEWNYEIYVPLDPDDQFSSFCVAQYQLKSLDSLTEKLLQFPKGAAFKLHTASTGRDDSDAEEVFKHAWTYLEEHGIKLQRAPDQ